MASTASLSIKLVRIGAALLMLALASIGLTLWVTWQLEGGAAAVNEPRIDAALAATRSAVPQNLPTNHRIFKQIEYVAAWARFGRDSPQWVEARSRLALEMGRTVETFPDVLVGAFAR